MGLHHRLGFILCRFFRPDCYLRSRVFGIPGAFAIAETGKSTRSGISAASHLGANQFSLRSLITVFTVLNIFGSPVWRGPESPDGT